MREHIEVLLHDALQAAELQIVAAPRRRPGALGGLLPIGDGTACDFHIDLASGALREVTQNLFTHLTSEELARHIGLLAQDADTKSPFQKQQDATVMNSAFKYIIGLAGRLAERDLWYDMPPQVFVRGAQRSAGEVKSWLAEMESDWKVLTKLEVTAQSSEACATFLRAMS